MLRPFRRLLSATAFATSELGRQKRAGKSKSAALAAVKTEFKAKYGADWSGLWEIILPILMKLLEKWLDL